MGRIKLVLALTAVTLAMLVASIPPALAASPEDSIVFFPVPLGNGATYSCAGGPPFVSNGDDSASGNCSVEQIGPPADLVCDVPTTIKFVHDMHSFVADASICHSNTDELVTPA